MSLFKGYLHEYLQDQRGSMRDEIKGISASLYNGSNAEEIKADFIKKYSYRAPTYNEADIGLEKDPVERGGKIYFTIVIPFEGDSRLLSYMPSNSRSNLAHASSFAISTNEYSFSYCIESSNPRPIQDLYVMDIDSFKFNIVSLARDLETHNQEVIKQVNEAVTARLLQIEKGKTAINSIPLPVKRRTEIPTVYTAKEVRRKPEILAKEKTGKAVEGDPVLDMTEYEYILNVIKDMALAMEKTPTTFARLTEPEIRDFFLILLNGHYEGNATGETFNGKGKTDIIIKHKSANIFISECKFWKGAGGFSETIDQLLGYTTLRDTKTALIMFIRGTKFSTVTKQIDELVRNHPNYKEVAGLAYTKEDLRIEVGRGTMFLYKFANPVDNEKELYLTVMLFHMPEVI